MRIGRRPLGAKAYEAEITKLVAEFQRRLAAREVRGLARKLVDALQAAGRPVTRHELDALVEIPFRSATVALERWTLAGRLGMLVERGCVRITGSVHRLNKQAPLYEYVTHYLWRNKEDSLRAWLYARAAKLECQRARGVEMGVMIEELLSDDESDGLDGLDPERTREILRARAEGESLAEIGAIYGLTRERIRQIEQRFFESYNR